MGQKLDLDGLDEIALIVELWQQQRTRDVALKLADDNRLRAAQKPRKEAA